MAKKEPIGSAEAGRNKRVAIQASRPKAGHSLSISSSYQKPKASTPNRYRF